MIRTIAWITLWSILNVAILQVPLSADAEAGIPVGVLEESVDSSKRK